MRPLREREQQDESGQNGAISIGVSQSPIRCATTADRAETEPAEQPQPEPAEFGPAKSPDHIEARP